MICMLRQHTSAKRWFANGNMTSYCDVKNGIYPVTMTTIRYCSILEFGRGHTIKQAAPGITRPLHTIGHRSKTEMMKRKIKSHFFDLVQSVFSSQLK